MNAAMKNEVKEFTHEHAFHMENKGGERRTRVVVVITLAMMVAEITAGLMFGSMALLADGWHMGTHAAALGITLFAYWYARKHADNVSFSFGTGKVGVLGGFGSAVGLVIVALLMGAESIHRLIEPTAISFNEAIGVAVVGLIVNVGCAILLKDDHSHHHEHSHEHEHEHVHHSHGKSVDHNLRAAYLHVLADALTSVLAIGALLVGKYVGWTWMDALMGIVGGVVIFKWSLGLLRDTSSILLDKNTEPHLTHSIRESIEQHENVRVVDLHVWKLSSHHLAAVVSICGENLETPEVYRQQLSHIPKLSHVSIEVNHLC